MSNEKSRLVYSTEQPSQRQNKPVEKSLHTDVSPARQRVTVSLDRKSRGGRSVTVIRGLLMPMKEREALLKQLKTRLGTGGTFKGAAFEIQGDQRDILMAVLEKMGYRPKRSGG
ncbi:MAG: translation initiation factor family protein [Nitrospirae bacterium]|nr:translation initiation factor family protein [Nitrospirota bacterium]MBS1126646.1 translation initiation factor family protein [Nitrospirota bacterium]